MFSIISLAAILAAIADASQYYYAPIGPWGLESTIINAKAIRKADSDHKVKTTSRKTTADDDKVEIIRSNLIDELEQAEEAFEQAVEHAEEAVVHALDDEVETFFPHHKESEDK